MSNLEVQMGLIKKPFPKTTINIHGLPLGLMEFKIDDLIYLLKILGVTQFVHHLMLIVLE